MKLYKKALLVFFCIGAGLALLFGSFIYTTKYKISDIDSDMSADGNHEIIFQAISAENISFSTAVVENEKGETVFSTSISDFIWSFNSIYEQMHAADYLTSSSNWMHIHDESPCFEYDSVHYIFSADERIGSMPTVSIYIPENEDGIYEIKLTFDEHGYQESLYEEFEKICFCSLKAALPELGNTNISDLYEKLYL